MMRQIIAIVLFSLALLISGCAVDYGSKKIGTGRSITIEEQDKICEKDSDCTVVLTKCDECECGEAVNARSKDKYTAMLRSICEQPMALACDINCPEDGVRCVNNICASSG